MCSPFVYSMSDIDKAVERIRLIKDTEIARLQAALAEKQALYEVVSKAGQVFLTNMELLEKKVFQLTEGNTALKEKLEEAKKQKCSCGLVAEWLEGKG